MGLSLIDKKVDYIPKDRIEHIYLLKKMVKIVSEIRTKDEIWQRRKRSKQRNFVQG